MLRNSRHAQDSAQLFHCLLASLSPEGLSKVTVWEQDYMVEDMGSGTLLLKVIIRESDINTNATVPASPATPGLSLRGTIQIGNGRALHDWSTNDVDRWLLQWGANDAVRRRFAEIEIDGELLTLLERSDMEGEMGLLELTSAL